MCRDLYPSPWKNEKCVEETKLPYLQKRTSLKGNEKKRVIDLNMFKDIHNKVFIQTALILVPSSRPKLHIAVYNDIFYSVLHIDV